MHQPPPLNKLSVTLAPTNEQLLSKKDKFNSQLQLRISHWNFLSTAVNTVRRIEIDHRNHLSSNNDKKQRKKFIINNPKINKKKQKNVSLMKTLNLINLKLTTD